MGYDDLLRKVAKANQERTLNKKKEDSMKSLRDRIQERNLWLSNSMNRRNENFSWLCDQLEQAKIGFRAAEGSLVYIDQGLGVKEMLLVDVGANGFRIGTSNRTDNFYSREELLQALTVCLT